MKTILPLVLLLMLTNVALAGERETKLALVNEYFEIVRMEQLWKDIMEEMSKQLPEDKRAEFLKMSEDFDVNYLERVAKNSLMKHLTVDELKVYVEFIRKPEALSALNKMKYYFMDIMPVIRMEVQKLLEQNQKK